MIPRRVKRTLPAVIGDDGTGPMWQRLSPDGRQVLRLARFAADYADHRGDTQIGPQHLLYGALRDSQDPSGTQLSRRSRTSLATLGWTPGRPNPLRLLLQARGIDPATLAANLARSPS